MKAVVGIFTALSEDRLSNQIDELVFSIITSSITKRDTSPWQEAIYVCARRHLYPPQKAVEDVTVSF
jgi:hypothetical protein